MHGRRSYTEVETYTLINQLVGVACQIQMDRAKEEEEEGFYKFLPANTADRLCQSWQSCSNHHEI